MDQLLTAWPRADHSIVSGHRLAQKGGRAVDLAQVVDHLPGKCKDMSLNPSTLAEIHSSLPTAQSDVIFFLATYPVEEEGKEETVVMTILFCRTGI